ncbi:hypothetical protein ACIP2X_37720 [Streptomyces sp. NPDC089424]|uniref:hypothetical protein n=1 Tax=Streptomyces sp. NPDC089424 TaxID=3365917 RepID=UPI0038124EF5
MEHSLFIDQALIQAPNFPRSLGWWQRRLPVWLDASVDDQGRVKVEPNGWCLDGSFEDLSLSERRRELTAARSYLSQRPHFASALVGCEEVADAVQPKVVDLHLPEPKQTSAA